MRVSPSLLAVSLGLLLTTSCAHAASTVELQCATRGDVQISSFKYKLTTMKWDDRFQIASGTNRHQTREGKRYEVTHFRNGDDLVYFPDEARYYLFYAGKDKADNCSVKESWTLPVVNLPRYEKAPQDALS
ncbi:hypothetical protein [Siccibacter turicensis]|uniref:hypothetical protein n=1 Tax=Siccibacter turicensis TaxID=357233 RepID=UPI002A69E210|nr:hypothetical protein [Siccibacter turicensis]MDY0971065.1 hypothetical protein [Siccibacter turicensis]